MQKIIIVDDHSLFRAGVRQVVEALDHEVTVLEATNAEGAFALLDQHADTTLVLLDLALPGMDGHSALEEIQRRYPSVPVAMISAAEDSRDMVTALNMGAVGFIPKSLSREVILGALRLILAGGIYVPPQTLGIPGTNGTAPAENSLPAPRGSNGIYLTERQKQILAGLAQGKPNKVIARDLGLAESTVKSHVSEIFRTLRVTNRAQAVVVARQLCIR